jgi:hypothetical protein
LAASQAAGAFSIAAGAGFHVTNSQGGDVSIDSGVGAGASGGSF